MVGHVDLQMGSVLNALQQSQPPGPGASSQQLELLHDLNQLRRVENNGRCSPADSLRRRLVQVCTMDFGGTAQVLAMHHASSMHLPDYSRQGHTFHI